MAHRGGVAPEDCNDEERQRQDQGDFHRAGNQEGEGAISPFEYVHDQLSFRPLEMRREMRSSSSGEMRATSPPRSAATTFSVEPSKNVSTRWRSAERRATSRGTAGMYT